MHSVEDVPGHQVTSSTDGSRTVEDTPPHHEFLVPRAPPFHGKTRRRSAGTTNARKRTRVCGGSGKKRRRNGRDGSNDSLYDARNGYWSSYDDMGDDANDNADGDGDDSSYETNDHDGPEIDGAGDNEISSAEDGVSDCGSGNVVQWENERWLLERTRGSDGQPSSVTSSCSANDSPPPPSVFSLDVERRVATPYERRDARMVRVACLNCRNRTDLSLLEWSEAVLLQLCHLERRLDTSSLAWSEAIGLLVDQWLPRLMRPLRVYVSDHALLQDILYANRRYKIQSGAMPETERRVFVTAPRVDYGLLRNFKSSCLADKDDDDHGLALRDRYLRRELFKCNTDLFVTDSSPPPSSSRARRLSLLTKKLSLPS